MRINPAFDLRGATERSGRIDKVARQLEGQFAQMLVKSMRDASFGDSLFPGENKMFREMYDQKIAEAMTRGKGLGLSSMISRQLSGQAPMARRWIPAWIRRPAVLTSSMPARPAPSLPLEDGSQAVRLLQQIVRRCAARCAGGSGADGAGPGSDRRAREQHAPLAGHRRSVHRQPAGREDWRQQRPVVGHRQQPRHRDQPGRCDGDTAVAQLGEHGRLRRQHLAARAACGPRLGVPAPWSPRRRWKPAGASAIKHADGGTSHCSASRPMAGTASARQPAP